MKAHDEIHEMMETDFTMRLPVPGFPFGRFTQSAADALVGSFTTVDAREFAVEETWRMKIVAAKIVDDGLAIEVTLQQPDVDAAESTLRGLVKRLYWFPTCTVGGPLHIVTDDLNVDDDCLAFCERELDDHCSIAEASPADRDAIRETARAIIAALRELPVERRRQALE